MQVFRGASPSSFKANQTSSEGPIDFCLMRVQVQYCEVFFWSLVGGEKARLSTKHNVQKKLKVDERVETTSHMSKGGPSNRSRVFGHEVVN